MVPLKPAYVVDQRRPRATLLRMPLKSLILEKLPSDVLAPVFDYLSSSIHDISSVRLVCRAFYRISLEAFAESFNYRVFHPSVGSIRNLKDFAAVPELSLRLRTLRVSTIAIDTHRRGSDLMWDLFSMYNLRLPSNPVDPVPESLTDFMMMFREWEIIILREDYRSHERLSLMMNALGRLRALENIVIVSGSELAGPPIMPGFTRETRRFMDDCPVIDNLRLFKLEEHALTLDLLLIAITETKRDEEQAIQGTGRNNLPKLRSFHTQGRVSLTSLPNICTVAEPFTVSHLPYLTHLELRLCNPSDLMYHLSQAAVSGLNRYLPQLLVSMPSLTHLTIFYPKSPIRLLLSHPAPYFVDYLVEPFLVQKIRFRALTNLHFGDIAIRDPTIVRDFLEAHATTLRTLCFTSLRAAWPVYRLFIRSLGSLKLDTLKMFNNWTREEYAEHKAWEARARRSMPHYPEEWKDREEDYRLAAKVTELWPGPAQRRLRVVIERGQAKSWSERVE